MGNHPQIIPNHPQKSGGPGEPGPGEPAGPGGPGVVGNHPHGRTIQVCEKLNLPR